MSNSTIVDRVNDAALDVGYSLLDSLLTPEGIAISVGLASVLTGATMLSSYYSGGKKDWLTGKEAQACGLYEDPKKGIILGRYRGRLVCYVGDMVVGIDGTTGTGKTACAVLATLLSNEIFSFKVFDQKGSLYKLTSGRRATFGPIHQLNPWIANTSCYNPFDDLPNDSRIVSSLVTMYSILSAGSSADQKKTGGDPFFEKKPAEVWPFIAIQVIYGDDDSIKNIGGVLDFMSDGKSCFQEMVNNPRHPQCESVGRDMLSTSEATRSSIMTTIKATFSLWRDDKIRTMTSRSSFRMEDFVIGEPISVYLTAPAVILQRMMPFYVLMEEMLKLHLMDNTEVTLSGKKKIRDVCIVDDEAQNSKRPNIDILEIAREFRVRYFLGYQSLKAMFDLYGEPKLELIKMKVSYRPTVGSDVTKRLVEMSGTYDKKVFSYSQSNGGGRAGSTSKNWKVEQVPRMNKTELERMPPYGRAMLTHTSKPAILKTFDSKADRQFKKLIAPPYVPITPTFIEPTWAGVSKPVVKSGKPPPQETEDEGNGIQQEEQNPTGAMLMMVNGFGNEEEAEEELQPPPQMETRKKRRVSL